MPELAIGVLIALLLGSYVWYTQLVVAELRREAELSSQMYARVYHALSDTAQGAGTEALLDLSKDIREQGVPVIVTDRSGRPAYFANLPFSIDVPADDPRVWHYVGILDRENAPVTYSGVGQVHYGNPPIVQGLRVIPALQATTAAILLFAGFYVLRIRGHASREHIWAGMARESAHQLGTPLSSLAGWIELLESGAADDRTHLAVEHMRADLERLDRVAHRFERIGREPRHDRVEMRAVVDRVAAYFRSRVPTLARAIRVDVRHEEAPSSVDGDPVLLEWALEVLIKNSVDALSGRGGEITVSTAAAGVGGVRVRVEDDGPGIPRDLRGRIFEPGFSTKQGGWGIGLSLAKRIIEENHGGRLTLVPTDRGATFDIILPG